MSPCKSLRPAEMVFGRKEVDVVHKSQWEGAWTTVTPRSERDAQIWDALSQEGERESSRMKGREKEEKGQKETVL